jgi:predicted ATPase
MTSFGRHDKMTAYSKRSLGSMSHSLVSVTLRKTANPNNTTTMDHNHDDNDEPPLLLLSNTPDESNNNKSNHSLFFSWNEKGIEKHVYEKRGYLQTLHEAYRRQTQRHVVTTAATTTTMSRTLAVHNSKEILLVTGPSGVGKTGLALTLRQQVTRDGGFFLRGQFDPPTVVVMNNTATTNANHNNNLLSSSPSSSFVWKNSFGPFVSAMTEFVTSLSQRRGHDASLQLQAISTRIHQELHVTELQALKESIPALRQITQRSSPTRGGGGDVVSGGGGASGGGGGDNDRSTSTSTLSSISPHPHVRQRHQQQWHGLKGLEAEKRYMYLLTKLFLAISSDQYPLVLLLDDLQWADAQAMQLVQQLLLAASNNNSNRKRFLLIGTVRVSTEDHENQQQQQQPSSTIPLVELMQHAGVTVTEITMSNLTQPQVQELISESLSWSHHQPPPLPHQQQQRLSSSSSSTPPSLDTQQFAKRLYDQTHGNLFFIMQLLSVLPTTKGVLCSGHGRENDDDETANNNNNHHLFHQYNSVLDVITSKILQLPDYDRGMLKIASCMGRDLYECLLEETALPAASVRPALLRAQALGLITLDLSHRCGRFVHDGIQEAAYSLIPESQRARAHLDIGLRLWVWLRPKDRQLHLFTIANQIIQGMHLLEDPLEKERLAEFMLQVGEKALLVSSFSTAAAYFQVGIQLLRPRSHWKSQYALSLSLYTAAAEVEYYNGHLARVDTLVAEILQHAKTLDDKLQAYFTHIYSLGSRDDTQQALAQGLQVLQSLGEQFPQPAHPAHATWALARCKWMLRNMTDDDIMKLPPMKCHRKLVIQRPMNTMYGYALVNCKVLVTLIVTRMVENTLRHGISAMSKYMFVVCDVIKSVARMDF